MTNKMRNKLEMPFAADEVEWRVSRAMKTRKGPMATVLCYLTSRAVMTRLDDVFGQSGWQDSYEMLPDGVICTLRVKYPDSDDWITKQDGAPQTNVEGFKGGISDALKRTGVKFGIGRYLYGLTENWVEITQERGAGSHYINDNKKEIKGFWLPPQLPAWALPD